LSPDESLVEIIEIPEHPWFVAVQFHPEFKSKPTCAHPLFAGFVGAAIKKNETKSKVTKKAEAAAGAATG
jgi:CTP synthase